MSQVPCTQDGTPLEINAEEETPYTHVLTQIAKVKLVEEQTMDGSTSNVTVQLQDMSKDLSDPKLTIESVPGMSMLAMTLAPGPNGKQVWQCLWEKPPDLCFPVLGDLVFSYPSLCGKMITTSGEVEISDPSHPRQKKAFCEAVPGGGPQGGCCVVM